MFAGIVERVCRVRAVQPAARAVRLEVELGDLAEGLPLGASVAINGVCLTLAGTRAGVCEFDVIPETWRSSSLQDLRPGDSVNTERSLRVGDRIDGHFVQGHVDGVGTTRRLDQTGGQQKLWVAAPNDLEPYIVRKGSVAVDGVSLTIADVSRGEFSVALIPTTLESTILGQRRAGDRINIETDIIARVVVHQLRAGAGAGPADHGGELTIERLRNGGLV